jgi:hypothetical protein
MSRPHWILTGCGTLLLALIAAAVSLGGPEDAWLKTQALWGAQPAPQILALEGDPKKPSGTFVVTIRNPAIEDVVVTGYVAEPLGFGDLAGANVSTDMNAVEDGAGLVPVATAEERSPDPCNAPRVVRLPRPFVVEPKRAGALTIRPWESGCPFAVRVTSNHGQSEPRDTFTEAVRGMKWTER